MRRQLVHRHVVIVVPSEAAHGFAAGWLSQLAMVSDRRHVCIERVAESTSADEVMIATHAFDPAARVRSYELVAGAFS